MCAGDNDTPLRNGESAIPCPRSRGVPFHSACWHGMVRQAQLCPLGIHSLHTACHRNVLRLALGRAQVSVIESQCGCVCSLRQEDENGPARAGRTPKAPRIRPHRPPCLNFSSRRRPVCRLMGAYKYHGVAGIRPPTPDPQVEALRGNWTEWTTRHSSVRLDRHRLCHHACCVAAVLPPQFFSTAHQLGLSRAPVALGGIHERRGVSASKSTAGGTRHNQDRDHDPCPNCGRDLLCHRGKPRYSLPACVYQDMCSPSTSRQGVQSTSNNTSCEQQFESEGLRHYTVNDRVHRRWSRHD